MQPNRLFWTVLTIAVAISVGFYAGVKHLSETHEDQQVVVTYKVPQDSAESIRWSLNKLFAQKDNDNSLGTSQVFGNGLLLVRATPSFQLGVKHLIDELGTEKPRARAVIRLDYWLIAGETAKESNLNNFPRLNSVLSSIDKVDGSII